MAPQGTEWEGLWTLGSSVSSGWRDRGKERLGVKGILGLPLGVLRVTGRRRDRPRGGGFCSNHPHLGQGHLPNPIARAPKQHVIFDFLAGHTVGGRVEPDTSHFSSPPKATLLQASGTSSYCNDSQEPPCLHSPFATQQPGAATKMKIRAHLPPLPTLENPCCSENKM